MKLFYNPNASRRVPMTAGALLCFVWMLALTLGGVLSLTGTAAASPVTTSTLALAALRPLGALDGQGNGPEGAYPVASVTVGAYGILYGATVGGGVNGAGTIFKINPDGTGYTVLHSLDPAVEGASPMGTLEFYGDDVLYGTTSDQGPSGGGTVWTMKTDGSGFTVLHSFPATIESGSSPTAGLVSGGDGFFYGSTSGGSSGGGVVYRIAPDGTGFAVLHQFYGDTPLGPLLLRAGGGVLYGTTYAGGDNAAGSVFKICTGGSGYTVLYSFTGGADGGFPQAGLIDGGDGFFYGTTSDSQLASNGSVFKIAPDGSGFTTLYRFSGGVDGGSPYAPVALGQDGKLYGVTFGGGATGMGTVFAISPNGTGFTTVASLSGTGGDGGGPSAGLTLGTQGQWYGSSYQGGPNGTGALFALTPAPNQPVHLTPATSVATHAHILWNNPDGSASLWDLSDPDPASTARAYGPYPGWTAETIADGPNNIVSLLWRHSSGAMCIWRIDAAGVHTSSPIYGPSNTWVAKAIAVGGDGNTRVLWNHSSGTALLWTVDTQGGLLSSTSGYTPAAGWTATTLAVGSDGNTHVLWNHSSGACQLWTLNAQGVHTDSPVYGPSNTWVAKSIAVGGDGNTRVLWNHSSGTALLWTVDTQGGLLSSTSGYAPPTGGAAGGITVSADGLTHLLWNEAGGTCQVWTLDAAGAHTDSPVYSLAGDWQVAGLAN